MGVSAGLYMYDVVVKKFTFAISSPDEFLSVCWVLRVKVIDATSSAFLTTLPVPVDLQFCMPLDLTGNLRFPDSTLSDGFSRRILRVYCFESRDMVFHVWVFSQSRHLYVLSWLYLEFPCLIMSHVS